MNEKNWRRGDTDQGGIHRKMFFCKKFVVPSLAENKIRIGANFIYEKQENFIKFIIVRVSTFCVTSGLFIK